MRLRAQARAHWRAWLGLALAFGIAGGAATAAAAGARRTASAYPRFVEVYEADHVIFGGLGEDDPDEIARMQREIAALPMVERATFSQFVTFSYLLPNGAEVSFPETLATGDASGTALPAKILRGRMFDRDSPVEAVVDFISAERFDLDVGDTVTMLLFDPETFELTVRRPVTIVGVVVVPGTMPAVGQTPFAGIAVSPGFIRDNAANIPPNEDAPAVRLVGGVEQIPELLAAVNRIAPDVDVPFTLPRHAAGVQKTLRFDVAALWILTALLGVSTFFILGQAIGRQVQAEAGGHSSLRAVGMGRGQFVGVDLLRALAVGGVASAVSGGVALAASPLTPRGLARVVEPDPGFYADWTIIGIGAAATLFVPIFLSVVPAIRAARHRAERVTQPSRIATALAVGGAGPSVVAGTRLALEPGRGSRSVPVGATIGGIALALAAFTAAGSFTDSLHVLISRPELSGFGWDMYGGSGDSVADAQVLAADPDVETFSIGGYDNITIAGRQLIPLVYEPGSGIGPTILEGRAPAQDDEISLGSTLMRSLGLGIGDTVMIGPSEQPKMKKDGIPAQPYTIVGRTVVPPVFFLQVGPGESAAITLDGVFRLDPEEARHRDEIPHLIKFRDGVDIRAKVNELRAKLPGLFVGQIRQPGAELSALSRSAGLPMLLTVVLLLMAVATLVHALVTSFRKRRHDLAILKTLGFVRRQVRAAVAWQAGALAVFGLVIGIPAGVALGRWSWRWFANSLGVIPDPAPPPVLFLLLVGAATVALANLIALLPARAAARTQAAVVLRTE